MDVKLNHNRTTRLVHAGLALAIIMQLLSAQFMQVPRDDRLGNTAFEVHEYSGMLALGLAVLFWLTAIRRTVGTDAAALLPWFNAGRRHALRQDLLRFWQDLKRLKLPAHRDASPLVSGIHGLGLLLVTGMALSGTIYAISGLVGGQKNGAVHLMMDVHGAAGNLVWAYLIGHAGMAVIYHFKSSFDLRDMWSFRSGTSKGN
ncbi:MAG: cytochrome b/b6 domain-containing protein [Sulfitobacter sp.]